MGNDSIQRHGGYKLTPTESNVCRIWHGGYKLTPTESNVCRIWHDGYRFDPVGVEQKSKTLRSTNVKFLWNYKFYKKTKNGYKLTPTGSNVCKIWHDGYKLTPTGSNVCRIWHGGYRFDPYGVEQKSKTLRSTNVKFLWNYKWL